MFPKYSIRRCVFRWLWVGKHSCVVSIENELVLYLEWLWFLFGADGEGAAVAESWSCEVLNYIVRLYFLNSKMENSLFDY